MSIQLEQRVEFPDVIVNSSHFADLKTEEMRIIRGGLAINIGLPNTSSRRHCKKRSRKRGKFMRFLRRKVSPLGLLRRKCRGFSLLHIIKGTQLK